LGGSSSLNEDAVVDLEKAEELQNFAGLGGDFIDTCEMFNDFQEPYRGNYSPPDTHHKVHLGLSRDVEVTSASCSALQAYLLLLLRQVFLHIRLCALEDDPSLGFGSL
jgi:hypothetical protein